MMAIKKWRGHSWDILPFIYCFQGCCFYCFHRLPLLSNISTRHLLGMLSLMGLLSCWGCLWFLYAEGLCKLIVQCCYWNSSTISFMGPKYVGKLCFMKKKLASGPTLSTVRNGRKWKWARPAPNKVNPFCKNLDEFEKLAGHTGFLGKYAQDSRNGTLSFRSSVSGPAVFRVTS